MVLKHKGEFQVEDGFGLPKKTTAQRAAYTPPEDGYQVFDTDLGQVATWTVTGGWSILGFLGDIDEDKIDILHGYAKGSLSLQTQISDPGLRMSTIAEQLTDNYILDNIFYGRQTNVLLQDPIRLRSYSTQSWASAAIRGDTAKTSGKWFWETQTGSTVSSTRNHAHGVTANINTLGGELGADSNSWGVESRGGNIKHNGVVINTIPSFGGPQSFVKHKLDLDNGIYEISVDSRDYVVVDNNLPSGSYLPLLAVFGSAVPSIRIREGSATTVSVAPEGFSFWMPAFVPSSAKVKIESEQDDGDLCILNTSGNTEFALKDGEMTANAPILGIDGTDPASLVTRASVDRFLLNFNTGNWTTVNGISTLDISHGLNFIPTETLFDVQVLELINGNYKSASIEHTTDQTTGIITLHTLGLPFDGRIRISK